MNSPKQKPILAFIRRNSSISSSTILITYMSSQIAPRTMIKTACAVDVNKTILRKALPLERSIFSAEAHAIGQALNIISKSRHNKSIIFWDSLSVLQSLSNKNLKNPQIIKLLSKLSSMLNCKEIIMCWIPSHIGVRGNERANSAVKSALDMTPNKSKIP